MSSTAELEKRLLNDIALYGWHVIKVPEDDLGPSYGHSVGLYHTFNHPEIIVIGLELDAIHYIINRLGDTIREGFVFQPNQFYSNIIENVDCYFTLADSKYYDEYVGYAKLFYKENEFPLLQCIYPTISGIYPWQDEWPTELKSTQPILKHITDSKKG